MNEKMLFRYEFRTNDKPKWMADQLKFNQSSKDWTKIKNTAPTVDEPFTGGKDLVLKNSVRRRVKRRDVSPVQFNSSIKQDPWQHDALTNLTKSIRSIHSIRAVMVNQGIPTDTVSTESGFRVSEVQPIEHHRRTTTKTQKIVNAERPT